jgi:hypothetical protein
MILVVMLLVSEAISITFLTKMLLSLRQTTRIAILLVVGWWKLDIPGLTVSDVYLFVGRNFPLVTWDLFS